jgi:hypothetical protein
MDGKRFGRSLNTDLLIEADTVIEGAAVDAGSTAKRRQKHGTTKTKVPA